MKTVITKELASRTWDYNRETGEFSRKKWVMNGKKGGFIDKHGYIIVCVNSRKVFAHRLAWLICYGNMPERDLDHINGIPSDNRICNLRLATVSENRRNSSVRKDSATGVKGVRQINQKFQAYIRVNRVRLNLGVFPSLHEASEAYDLAAKKYFGAFACSSRPYQKHPIARAVHEVACG